ncbi:MAG: IPT/TIG domain-containing protein [Myxococcus sp.]|nr:IPT/TIG domain-containing protein [Myxococcus sp.]
MRLRLAVLGVLPLAFACPGPTNRPDAGAAIPPTVMSVSPTSGPMTGGTTVTINGSRFVDGATVTFGDAPGVQVVVQNALRLTVRTPAVTNAGRVAVTVTNPDGASGALPDAFTFEAPAGRTITEAIVTLPADTTDRTGAAMVQVGVNAQVEVPMVTKGAGQGTGVRGQVGFARTLSTPPSDADFTWTDATYSADADGAMAGDTARDVYGATVTVPGATTTGVTYRLAARFSTDNGATWRLADRDGLANGVQEAQLARLAVEPRGVDWCRMGGRTPAMAPPVVTLRGTQTGPTIFAQVFSMGRTEPMGAGAGVKGQLGYGAMGTSPSTWTWVDGAYNVDVGNNDEWQATLPNPGEGTYRFAWRFNLDDGAFTYCVNDGPSPTPFNEAQSGTLTVSTPGVDSCVLQFPNAAQALVGEAGPIAYGRVFAGGITDRLDGGAPAMITMELGTGPGGVMPDQASWSWGPATFNVEVMGGGAEFQARLPASPLGTYAFAFRARLASGAYTYCDLDGSQNGFQNNQTGVFRVAPFSFDECRLQFPAALTTYQGRPSELVFGQVFAPGVTSVAADAGAPAGLEAELGFGPDGGDPSAPDAGWSWTAATFNVPVMGGGAEYQSRLTGPAPGAYSYAYRVRYQSGAWTYCDRDGASNGYQAAQAGGLTARAFDVDECFVDTTALTSAPSMPLATPYLARVRVPTLTEAMGQGAGVTAEIGYGPIGSLPSTWTSWTAAAFDADAMAFDRYAGSFTAPGALATYDVAFRFRVGARPFVYCDRDGQQNGYSSAMAAQLTVSNSVAISACQLLTPSAFMLASGSPLSVSVNVAGTGTAAPGAAPGLRAQIGMGAQDDASTSPLWGWANATYLNDVSGRDVYGLTFQPSYTGLRAVSARVSADDGMTWTYCDLNGSDQNGYEVSQQYNVTVERHTSIQFCKLQFPYTVSLDAGTSRVYGQVFQSGLTPDAGAPVRAQFGIGARNNEPALAWQWSPAPFLGFGLPPDQNNNEYAVDYRPDAGNPNYAFRFSLDDGGTWCYADNDGNGANGLGNAWDGFRGDLTGTPNLGVVTP